MTNQAAVAIIVRLLGIWIALDLLQRLPSLVSNYVLIIGSDRGDGAAFWVAIVLFLVVVALSALMICIPLEFANGLLPRNLHGEGTTAWTADELEGVAFSAVGAFVLTMTVPHIGDFVQIWLSFMQQPQSQWNYPEFDWTSALAFLLKVLVGIWLLLGAKSLRRFLQRIRNAGTT